MNARNFTVALALFLVGCGPPPLPEKPVMSTVQIDGCQYLCWNTYCGYPSVAHKGDCTNAIHRYSAEPERSKTIFLAETTPLPDHTKKALFNSMKIGYFVAKTGGTPFDVEAIMEQMWNGKTNALEEWDAQHGKQLK